MRQILNDRKILLNRGDNLTRVIFLNQGSKLSPIQYVLRPGDKLYVGISEPNQCFEEAIIKKVYTSDNLNSEGNVVLKLSSLDTLNLLPGLYYYEIKLLTIINDDEEYVCTVVPKTKFEIL